MPEYTVTVRYDDGGTPTSQGLTVTAAAPELVYIKDGDTYRVHDDAGDVYVFPETALIYMRLAV